MKRPRMTKKLYNIVLNALRGKFQVTIYKGRVSIRGATASPNGKLIMSCAEAGQMIGYAAGNREAGRKMVQRLIESEELAARRVSPRKWEFAVVDLDKLRQSRVR